jgi:hypothetical protein
MLKPVQRDPAALPRPFITVVAKAGRPLSSVEFNLAAMSADNAANMGVFFDFWPLAHSEAFSVAGPRHRGNIIIATAGMAPGAAIRTASGAVRVSRHRQLSAAATRRASRAVAKTYAGSRCAPC